MLCEMMDLPDHSTEFLSNIGYDLLVLFLHAPQCLEYCA